jgi:hypothetical protein
MAKTMLRLFAGMALVASLGLTGGCEDILGFKRAELYVADAGTGTGTGTSTTGSGSVCVPKTTAPCYDGPPGTEGMGVCSAGIKTCNDQGTAYGPCVGEVTPQKEDCKTSEDEDCDGQTPPCIEKVLWAELTQGGGEHHGQAVAASATGDALVAGWFHGTFIINGQTFASMPQDQGVLLKLNSDGSFGWAPNPFNGYPRAVAADAAGNWLVAGSFSGGMTLAGSQVQSAGGTDVFVAKLAPDGTLLWAKPFGDAADQSAFAVAADGKNVLVAGTFAGKITFGSTSLNSQGALDIFVAKLDPDGNAIWAKGFGTPYAEEANAIAVDGAGNVLVGGSHSADIQIGSFPLHSSGGKDALVFALDASGSPLWANTFGDAADQVVNAVAFDAGGNAIIVGSLAGAGNPGAGLLLSMGGQDVFVAKYDPTGKALWNKAFGDASDQVAWGVGATPAGNVIIIGSLQGMANFGGGALVSSGGQDVFLANIDKDGHHIWSDHFGDPADQHGQSVAVDGAGNVVITGDVQSTVNFGTGPLTFANGTSGIFIAKFQP